MYRLKEIQTALAKLVGWEQIYPLQVDAELCETESGLTFNGAHPLCTLENVASVMPDGYSARYGAFNENIAYRKDDKVSYGGKIYKAIAPTIGETPDNNIYWHEFNPLSDYSAQLMKNGIAQTVQRFVTDKQKTGETRNLLERRAIADGAGRLTDVIRNEHKIVGLEITPIRSMGVTTKIERIGLQMSGNVGVLPIYLFHSSRTEPIAATSLNFERVNGGFQWFDLSEWYMPYVSQNTSAGGSWYICYSQNDMPTNMAAVNLGRDFSKDPCATCSMSAYNTWKEITKYIQIAPFSASIPAGWDDEPTMFDVQTIAYTSSCNYGMNAVITVGCDLTDFIIEQRAVFANVIQKQVAVNVLRTIAMNPSARVNRNQVNASRTDLLYEIDGNTNSPRAGGLGNELADAYKAISVDTQGIDRVCLACNNHGVRYSVV